MAKKEHNKCTVISELGCVANAKLQIGIDGSDERLGGEIYSFMLITFIWWAFYKRTLLVKFISQIEPCLSSVVTGAWELWI